MPIAIRGKPSKEYFDLVRMFPLTRIQNREHLAKATDVIDRLLATNLDDGGRTYLDALTELVEAYESVHEKMPDVSQVDMLKFLMRQNSVSQIKLARESGIAQSTISAVLAGERQMTTKHMVGLARFFHVSPAVFLPRL